MLWRRLATGAKKERNSSQLSNDTEEFRSN